MKTATATMQYKWITHRDLDRVMEIDSICHSDPRTRDEWHQLLGQMEVVGMGIERNGELAGFWVYRIKPTSIQLLILAVHPDHRRQKVGSMMLDKLKSKLSPKRNRITHVVHEGNLDGHLFLRSNHFVATRIMREYFGASDGYRFVFDGFFEE
jgi:[ribosomal protein S18]-alanine N-acetyltransferase